MTLTALEAKRLDPASRRGWRRLLLVEDSPVDAFLVEELLREVVGDTVGLDVSMTVQAAVAMLPGLRVDCVLLDLSLPDATGLEALRAVRAVAPDVPIVVLTGREDERSALEAMQHGGQDYLVKGRIDGNDLVRAISYACKRKAFEAELLHQAMHDPLTGLPNRALLRDRLGLALGRTGRAGGRVAVLFLDLNRFKVVNDSLGHATGDAVICEVAARLRAAVRPSDTVARFGGDEFVVVAEDVDRDGPLIAVANRILDSLSEPILLRSGPVHVSAAMGIAVSAGSVGAEELLANADAATYRAKGSGQSSISVFDEGLRRRAVSRLRSENDLHLAVAQGDFHVVYQPVIDMGTGEVSGAEALVRWDHPDRGIIAPLEFLPLAEETGLIVAISDQVFTQACQAGARWHPRQGGPFTLALNLSVRHLAEPDLASHLSELIRLSDLRPCDVVLELTETVLMQNLDLAVDVLASLRDMGVRIAIDDFGTGCSSLAYLKRLPIDIMKIDRSMVEGIGVRAQDTAIVGAMVGLAHALGLEVVAEGVEQHQQLEVLQDLGCDQAQGYWFGRPCSGAEFTEMLGSAA